MADTYLEVKPEEFTEKLLTTPQLTIVNFSVAQSNACSILEPEFVAISKEYQGRVVFAKVDISGQDELVNTWQISGVPTLLFIKGGKEVYRITGIMMRQKLRRQIEGILLAD